MHTSDMKSIRAVILRVIAKDETTSLPLCFCLSPLVVAVVVVLRLSSFLRGPRVRNVVYLFIITINNDYIDDNIDNGYWCCLYDYYCFCW